MPWKYNSQVLRISCTLLGPCMKYSDTLALMNYHALLPMPFFTFIISTVAAPPLNIGYQNGQARFDARAN